MQEERTKEVFAESLREVMEDEKLTVAAFADSIACDVAAVRRWLYREHFADALVLVRVVRQYRVSADYLFGLSDRREIAVSVQSDTFFARYCYLKQKNGMTDYAVGKFCRIKAGVISKWRKIRSYPQTAHLLRLAECLNCSLDYLLGLRAYAD